MTTRSGPSMRLRTPFSRRQYVVVASVIGIATHVASPPSVGSAVTTGSAMARDRVELDPGDHARAEEVGRHHHVAHPCRVDLRDARCCRDRARLRDLGMGDVADVADRQRAPVAVRLRRAGGRADVAVSDEHVVVGRVRRLAQVAESIDELVDRLQSRWTSLPPASVDRRSCTRCRRSRRRPTAQR